MQKLTDRVAIITGASRGLGKAMAVELAKEGASVAVAARTVEAGQGPLPGTIHETVETIKKLGGEALAIQCDVTDEDDVTAMVREGNEALRQNRYSDQQRRHYHPRTVSQADSQKVGSCDCGQLERDLSLQPGRIAPYG